MMLPKKYQAIFTFAVFATATIYPKTSFAQERWKSDVLKECPLETNIRASGSASTERFSALDACADRIIAAPAKPLPADDGTVVRIPGIRAEPLKQRDRAEQRRDAAMGYSPIAYSRGAYPRRHRNTVYDRAIRRTAAAYRIDPLFLHAVIDAESSYRPDAVSRAGAVGLMQIMPTTGAGLGVDRAGLFDAGLNIDAGARHLKQLQRRYGRNFDLILSAYNAGEHAVARHGNRIPPFRETQNYVGRVMGKYQALRSGYGHAK